MSTKLSDLLYRAADKLTEQDKADDAQELRNVAMVHGQNTDPAANTDLEKAVKKACRVLGEKVPEDGWPMPGDAAAHDPDAVPVPAVEELAEQEAEREKSAAKASSSKK